ncbi:MAG: serine/threonine-protein kinase, partial [Pseudomonadota bacterium]
LGASSVMRSPKTGKDWRMSPELWEQVQVVVDESLHLSVAERGAFLEKACFGNPELKREVDSLLAGADEASDFFEEPIVSLHTDRPKDAVVDRRVGAYKIRHQVGSGGMGSVYLASRADDFEKSVAIKILKRGMDTDEIVRRFEHERQILANLDHPNISKLLDGGTTNDGRPYFVMEQVEGEPIDRYCDDHRLSTRERLELFRKVCSAVHFAHQNLVVHRDLKPGNILVTEDGEPKLLDFGIAKLLESEKLSTQTPTVPMLTVAGAGPMTPPFASPEQVRGDAITTSSDVYSLGVLLFKLLTGHRPYRLRDHSMSGLFQAIQEEEPSKPSDAVLCTDTYELGGRISTLTPESVSETRDGDPRTLRRSLAGDLDCIVLKTLRKQPKDRYGSVEQLSEDIRRHLEGLPVLARQGTLAYQTVKFFRRHKTRIAMLGAVILTVLFGIGWGMSQTQAERERQLAARERQVSESLADMVERLRGLHPDAGEEPDFASTFHAELAQYVDDLKLAVILNDQADSLKQRGGITTAEIIFREALDMKRRLLNDEHPSVIRGMNNLADVLWSQGKYEEAEAIYLETIDLRIRVHGRESLETARTLNNLGIVYQNTGDLDAAERLSQESLDIRRRLLGPDSDEVGRALNNRAFLQYLLGNLSAAEADYREALRIFQDRYGSDDGRVARVLRNLAPVLLAKGDREGALNAAESALAILQKGFKHWQIADVESVLGECLMALGRFDQAEELINRSYPVIEAQKGPDARQTKEALARIEAFEAARTLAATGS